MWEIIKRELGFMRHNGLYIACLVAFPLLVMIFFTTLMGAGQPADMPVGVVDLDNSSMSRKVVRSLDAFQNTHVVERYMPLYISRVIVLPICWQVANRVSPSITPCRSSRLVRCL